MEPALLAVNSVSCRTAVVSSSFLSYGSCVWAAVLQTLVPGSNLVSAPVCMVTCTFFHWLPTFSCHYNSSIRSITYIFISPPHLRQSSNQPLSTRYPHQKSTSVSCFSHPSYMSSTSCHLFSYPRNYLGSS